MTVNVGMPFGAFLAALLVLIPLPGHWRARNIPTLSIIAWLFIVNITHGVNSIVWADNVDVKLVIWCDIVIRLDIGANLALPAACFCLCMHLESVASIRKVRSTMSDKRRRMVIDSIICIVLPMAYMAWFYVVQGHRFDLVEGFGCHAEDYVSVPEFFLVWFLPILFALGTFVFATLAFVHFFRRRANFAKHLSSSSAALTPSRYFRLMAMSLVEVFWSLLVVSLTLYFNYRGGLRPWTNWDDVHSNFSRINRFPRIFIPQDSLRLTYFLWWTTPISAYVFSFFFAFGQDAMREYYSYILWIRRKIFRQKSRSKGMSSLGSSLPYSMPTRPPKPPQPFVITINDIKSQDTLATPTQSDISKFEPLTSTSGSYTDSVLHYYESQPRSDIPQDVALSSGDDAFVSPSLSDSSTTHLADPSPSVSTLTLPPPPLPAKLGGENSPSPTLRYTLVPDMV